MRGLPDRTIPLRENAAQNFIQAAPPLIENTLLFIDMDYPTPEKNADFPR